MDRLDENSRTSSDHRFVGNLRSFIFGVEDSLVSTVGLLSGVAASGASTKTIILAGVVLIFVEAFSMGAGNLLSDNIAEEVSAGKEVPVEKSILPSITMFFSYLFAAFIPLFPYLIFKVQPAFWLSILLSLIALFVLGMAGVIMSHDGSIKHMVKHGMRMLVIGGIAVTLGVVVGVFVNGLM